MGICESLSNSDIPQSKSKSKITTNKNPYFPSYRGPNLFNTPIKGNNYNLNPNNISMSQSQLTLGTTILEHPFQRPQMHVYNSKSFQTSYINGNSMMNGNSITKNSKLNPDSFSMSRSCGEIIIDGKINPEMKGNKDFQNYVDDPDLFGEHHSLDRWLEITKEMLEAQDYVKSETTEPATKPSRRR